MKPVFLLLLPVVLVTGRLDLSPSKTESGHHPHPHPHPSNDDHQSLAFQCSSNETSFHADLKDCHSYYICYNGTSSHHTCPMDMAYHCEMNLCISDLYAPGCAPPVHCGQHGFLPDPEDCTKFYQCSYGHPHSMQCPVGTQFDPVALTCSTDASCLTGESRYVNEKACFTKGHDHSD